MQDISLLKQYLHGIQESRRVHNKGVAQGINPELTPEAAARNVMLAMHRGASPVEGVVAPSEAKEWKRDFPFRVN
jgi:hypothetical protein